MAASASFARRPWSGLSGVTSLALLAIAFVVGTAPEADVSDSKIPDYYTDSGNQAKQMISAVLIIGALSVFLVFLTGLRLLLVETGTPSPYSELALVGGLVFATLMLAGADLAAEPGLGPTREHVGDGRGSRAGRHARTSGG
jgi:hypothetical protein